MFSHLLRFELRYRFTQPTTYVYFAVFALFGFLSQTVDDFGFGSAKVHVNAPWAIAELCLAASTLGMFVTAALMGTPVYRDDKDQMTGLLYTTSVGKWAYLAARFLGSLPAIWFIMSGLVVGAVLGMQMPWVEASKIGPVPWAALGTALVGGAWVNALFAGCILFAAYLVFRSPLVVYLGGVTLFVFYQISASFADRVSSDHLFAQLDPFGLAAERIDTKYWTIAERNTLNVNFLTGELLQSRLTWSLVGLAVLLAAMATFRLRQARTRAPKRGAETAPVAAPGGALVTGAPAFGAGLGRWQTGRLARVQFLNVVTAWPFRALAALGVVFVLFNAWYTYFDNLRGAQLPVTYQVLRLVNDNFTLFFLIIITIYAGELVWRERDTRLNLLFDALPLPTAAPFLSKLLALVGAQVVLYGVLTAVALALQLYLDARQVEPLLYVQNFGLQLMGLLIMSALALAVQTIVNHKYVGHALMMVYYGVVFLLPDALGLHHALLKFGGKVEYTYSDLNGFGHFVLPLVALNLYYLAGTALLVLLAVLLWVRGTDTGLATRRRRFGQRLALPAMRPALTAAAAVLVGTGAWAFYNTNILNHYLAPDSAELTQVETEKSYKRYENLPQLKVAAIDLTADLYPTATPRRYRFSGTYTLVNRAARPTDTVLLNYDNSRSVTTTLRLDRAARVLADDPTHGVRLLHLTQPLTPGDSLQLAFTVEYRARGFSSRPKTNGVFDWASISPEDRLTANGSFLDGPGLRFGYQPSAELEDDDKRRHHGLKPKARMKALDDPRGRLECEFGPDADYARYRATVSTDPDQTAVTPGYLQKTWLANGRRYFRYQMDQPMLPMTPVLSARYAVHRESWQPADATRPPVSIEIYYTPKHQYNVARMAEALRKALPRYEAAFGPYQYRQLRILEFPRYKSFAQSTPNTVPFSEGAGFIRDLRDPATPDDVFFITNHELAHQWWGHQLVGANVQGGSMLIESLAEYSAILTAKHEFSPQQMQAFMRSELDAYLRGRRNERKKEMPLMRCENQPYIHYDKGGMVFYALQDLIGEEKLNGALRAFIDKNRYARGPYPTTADLMTYLRAATPDSLHYALHDMFETITLYKNELKTATYAPRPDGRYDVTLTVKAEKVRADSVGNETPTPLGDYVDVGVFAADPANSGAKAWDVRGKALILQKVKLTKPEMTFTYIVSERPAKAGVDPYQKLIERYYIDNVKPLEEVKAVGKAVASVNR